MLYLTREMSVASFNCRATALLNHCQFLDNRKGLAGISFSQNLQRVDVERYKADHGAPLVPCRQLSKKSHQRCWWSFINDIHEELGMKSALSSLTRSQISFHRTPARTADTSSFMAGLKEISSVSAGGSAEFGVWLNMNRRTGSAGPLYSHTPKTLHNRYN